MTRFERSNDSVWS